MRKWNAINARANEMWTCTNVWMYVCVRCVLLCWSVNINVWTIFTMWTTVISICEWENKNKSERAKGWKERACTLALIFACKFTIEIAIAWKKINEQEKSNTTQQKLHNNLKALKTAVHTTVQLCVCLYTFAVALAHTPKIDPQFQYMTFQYGVYYYQHTQCMIINFLNCLWKWQVFL